MSKKKRTKKQTRKDELARKRQGRLALALEQDAEFREDLEHQLEAFRKKFGRDPLPDDPIFFDPSKDEPTPLSEDDHHAMAAELMKAMVEVGRPEFAYAFLKSGYLVSEANHDLIPEAGLRAWDRAIQEWHDMRAEERATAIQGMVSRETQ